VGLHLTLSPPCAASLAHTVSSSSIVAPAARQRTVFTHRAARHLPRTCPGYRLWSRVKTRWIRQNVDHEFLTTVRVQFNFLTYTLLPPFSLHTGCTFSEDNT
jgi:hypothetical protein